MEYLNIQEKVVNGKGQRNVVQIRRNGTAKKTVERLIKGRVVKRKTRRLTKSEKRDILKGVFVPGLWNNCRITGLCKRS